MQIFSNYSHKDKIISQRINDLICVLGVLGFGVWRSTHTYITLHKNPCVHTDTCIRKTCKHTDSSTLTKQISSPLRKAESMDSLINTHLSFGYTPSDTPQASQINTHTLTHTANPPTIHQRHGSEQTSPTLIYHRDWK